MIVASKYIRPNSEYHIAVTIHNTTTPAKMTVGVMTSNQDYVNDKEITVEPGTTKMVMLEVGTLKTQASDC